MRIFVFLAALSIALPVAAQAPVELNHGEQITISCAPAPPACPGSCGDGTCDPGETQCSCSADCGLPPSSETGLCTDGVDNDCDGFTDCADSDCASDPACAPPPESGCFDGFCDAAGGEDCFTCWVDCESTCPVAVCGNGLCQQGEGTATCPADCVTPSGPPTTGLQRWYREDFVHIPPSIAPAVHHFPNLAPGDSFGAHAQGWDVAHQADDVAGGTYFSSLDQDSYSISPEFSSSSGWTFGYLGTLTTVTSTGVIGSDGVACDNLNVLQVEKVSGSPFARIALRMNASGHIRPAEPFIALGSQAAFVLTHDAATGAFRVWGYDGTAWTEHTKVPPAVLARPACWSCLGCYYPWWWEPGGGASQDQIFRDALLYDRVVGDDPEAGDLQQLMDYLAGEF